MKNAETKTPGNSTFSACFGRLARQTLPLLLLLPVSLACAQTTHEVIPSSGVAAGMKAPQRRAVGFQSVLARLSEPGPVAFKKIVAADWAVERGGLINLDHAHAKSAHLEDGPEAIQVYFYVLEHPLYGGFIVDSGIARSVAQRSEDMPVRFPVSSALPVDELKVHLDTKSYIESRRTPLRGVFLTHLHLDHILGLSDVPRDVPLYIGPGEAKDMRFMHWLVRPTTDLNLEGFGPLREWQVVREKGAPFTYVDIFGDQSVLGLHIPGHTRGNMGFLIRSTEGPQLLVGDGSHTDWGWENDVEPGTFNSDGDQAARSFAALRRLSKEHPEIEVHLGHQALGAARPKVASKGH